MRRKREAKGVKAGARPLPQLHRKWTVNDIVRRPLLPLSALQGRLTAIAGVLLLLIGEEVIQGVLGGITFLVLLEVKGAAYQPQWALQGCP